MQGSITDSTILPLVCAFNPGNLRQDFHVGSNACVMRSAIRYCARRGQDRTFGGFNAFINWLRDFINNSKKHIGSKCRVLTAVSLRGAVYNVLVAP